MPNDALQQGLSTGVHGAISQQREPYVPRVAAGGHHRSPGYLALTLKVVDADHLGRSAVTDGAFPRKRVVFFTRGTRRKA